LDTIRIREFLVHQLACCCEIATILMSHKSQNAPINTLAMTSMSIFGEIFRNADWMCRRGDARLW